MHLPEKCFVVLLLPLFLQMRAMCYLPCVLYVCVHVQHSMFRTSNSKLPVCLYLQHVLHRARLPLRVRAKFECVFVCVYVLTSPALSLPSLL